MSLIPTPATIESAPAASQALLQAVQKQLGVVPNLFRLVANSPVALEAYLGLSGTLSKGSIPGPTRERIALTIAEINGCNYCLSAHSYMAKNLAKLTDEEITANRHGTSSDAKADAALKFATAVAKERGHISESDFQAIKAAGYADAELIEIVLHVALNTWTNYMNSVAKTDLDFPAVHSFRSAA